MSEPPFAFLVQRPAGRLSRYVATLWYARGRIGYRRDAILPSGHVTLIVNLGAPHRTFDPGAPDDVARARVQREAWVCGQQRGPILSEPVAETHMVGADFHPGGAYPLLGVPVGELTDQLVPLADVWRRGSGVGVAELRERVAAARDARGKLRVFEAALARQLERQAHEPGGALRRIDHALTLLAAPRARPVADIRAQLGISHRHLVGEFSRFVGLTPKTFGRVVRFHRALSAIAAGQPVRWAALARDCEYYDQAHFIRDFRRFSGATPGEYVARRQAVYGAQDGVVHEAARFLPFE